MKDFININYTNVLIIHESCNVIGGAILGDFVYFCFYLAFYYKKYYNSNITVIANYNKISFFDNFKDLFNYIDIDNYIVNNQFQM